tara:strand:- start:52 stop:585 length:534 start_codon:yes stop_codon:yes gene_type:complete
MSRVGKNPIEIPNGVSITEEGDSIVCKGALGTLSQQKSKYVKVLVQDNQATVSRTDDNPESRAMHGTQRALIANMVLGVSKGFEKRLSLVGVGFRAQAQGDKLNLALGFSHPVEYKLPEGIKVETPSQTEIIVKGADKQKVGQVAAEIRSFRPPEPYKGKGVRYDDEFVLLKETKKK